MKWVYRVLIALLVVTVSWTHAAELQHRLHDGLTLLEKRGFDGVVGVSLPGFAPVFKALGFTQRIARKKPGALQIDLLSITKTITAAAVMRLVDQTRLRPDQRLDELLPAVPPDKARITIHQLLTHSAGFKAALGRDSEILLKDEFLSRAFASELRSPPGEVYHYSNVGYSILAVVIERVSGMTFEDFVEQQLLADHADLEFGYVNVFVPSRSILTNTSLHIGRASWGRSQPYWNLIGNGGLVSTASAMLEFRHRFNAGEIVSADSISVIQTPFVLEVPDTTHYGYGLVVEDHPQHGRIYWHNGGNGAFSSHWADYTDHQIILFVAVTGQPGASKAADLLAGCLFGGHCE